MVLFIQCVCLYRELWIYRYFIRICAFSFTVRFGTWIYIYVQFQFGMMPANILWGQIFFGFLFHLKMLLIWMTLCAGGLITPVWISTFLSQHSVHQFPASTSLYHLIWLDICIQDHIFYSLLFFRFQFAHNTTMTWWSQSSEVAGSSHVCDIRGEISATLQLHFIV